MTMISQLLTETLCRDKIKAAFEIVEFTIRFDRDFLAIDGQALVGVGDFIAGNTDNPFDVIQRRIIRITKHHHFAPLRIVDCDEARIDDRQADAVGEFVYQYEVPYQQRGEHRPRRNLEGLDQKRAQHEDDQNNRKKTGRVFDPPGLRLAGRAVLAEVKHLSQPYHAGEQHQHHHDECEIHALAYLSTCRMARKASCGISTVPTCFMRFLPAFCFSSSFFLREMSPP